MMLSNCALYSDQTTKLIKIIWSFISFKYHCTFFFVFGRGYPVETNDINDNKFWLFALKDNISGVAIPIMGGGA